MKGVKSLAVGVCSLLATVVIWTALTALRTDMIIAFGIIATDNIRLALIGLFSATGSLTTGWGLYQLVPGIIRNSSEDKLRKSSLSYRARSSGPKEVRDQLVVLKETRPRLAYELDRCLEQLVDISSLFSRFDQLIKSNEAETVSSARAGLEEIEGTVCANFKWVINSIIAADTDDTPETSVFYDQCIARIERVITANSRALDKGNQFLIEIADNVSQLAIDTTMLDAWMETIRTQNEQSLIGTREPR